MRSHKGIWSLMLGSTSIGMAMLLGGCSHDPIQPAPVLMMGRNGTTNAAVAAVAPAPGSTATSWRIAGAVPAPIAQHSMASPHVSSRPAAARKQSSVAEKARGHRIMHTPARHRSAKIYSAAAPNLSSTETIRAHAEGIPLDERPAATPAAHTDTPTAAAATPGQTSATWVSPVPADAPKPAFRPPSP